MPQKTNPEDPTLQAVRLLRESGYHEAASDLAVKALQRNLTTEQTPDAAALETPPAELTPEQAREQQGRAMLEQIQAQTGRNVTHTPLMED